MRGILTAGAHITAVRVFLESVLTEESRAALEVTLAPAARTAIIVIPIAEGAVSGAERLWRTLRGIGTLARLAAASISLMSMRTEYGDAHLGSCAVRWLIGARTNLTARSVGLVAVGAGY